MKTGMRSQRGATLFIALVMLVMLTMFAVSSLNSSTSNLKVVGNMQSRGEALNAAQETIETVISTPQFIANPANAVLNPCGAANTLCTDLTGDGTPDYTTQLVPMPTCVSKAGIKMTDLVLTNIEDLGCAAGQQQQFGVQNAVTGDSLCANTLWEITAQTAGAANSARVTVTQGVGVRISIDDMATSCL
jgi:Tfp pilus assembly protein PilX